MPRQPRLPQIDTLSAQRNPLPTQQLALAPPLGERSVGAHHAVPRQIRIRRGEYLADETGCVRIDVTVGPDEPLGDRADPGDDEVVTREVIVGLVVRGPHAGRA
jgi:hypothetical protein